MADNDNNSQLFPVTDPDEGQDRRGLFRRLKTKVWFWKDWWLEETVGQPLSENVDQRVPDWAYTGVGRRVLAVGVAVIFIGWASILVALML